MKPLKSKVRITLDEDLIQQIKKLADNDERSFSQYINMVLKEHVSQKKSKNNCITFKKLGEFPPSF